MNRRNFLTALPFIPLAVKAICTQSEPVHKIGLVTGRLSSSGVNLQTLPKDRFTTYRRVVFYPYPDNKTHLVSLYS